MRRKNCVREEMSILGAITQEEMVILTAIVALAQGLPIALGEYVSALGEIRRRYFGAAGHVTRDGSHKRKPRGFIEGHKPRATTPWQ